MDEVDDADLVVEDHQLSIIYYYGVVWSTITRINGLAQF